MSRESKRSLSLRALLLCVLAGLASLTWALIETEQLSSPVLNQRYQQLVAEYRCPKCQNQNLAESNSPISVDLRTQIRRLLEEGASDDEISAYLVARYGEFVLYRPKVQGTTYVLWLAPAVLLLLGLVTLVFIVKRQGRSPVGASKALNRTEQEALQALLDNGKTKAKDGEQQVVKQVAKDDEAGR